MSTTTGAASAPIAPPKFYERPAVALAGATALLLAAAWVFPNISPFPTLTKHVLVSVIVFMLAQVAAVIVHRRMGRVVGEWFGVALTGAMYLLACGPLYAGCLLGFVLITHYVLVRVFPYPVSMLALCLSSFRPTCRFGWMMSAQMLASLLGELVLLPVLLCLFTRARKVQAKPESQGHAHAVRRAA